MLLTEPITTPRLVLRPLTEADAAPPYLDWMHDPEILRYLEVRHAPQQTAADLAAFIAACNDTPSALLFGICLRGEGRHIGNIKLGSIDAVHRRADLGFLIGDRSVWGRGYAAEAIRAVAEFALSRLGLNKVVSGCYAGNAGSAGALRKAGFHREAVLAEHWRTDEGEFEDGWVFALRAKEIAS